MTKQRPRIGIPMRIEQTTNRFYLGRDYSEAVEAAGGIPIHISLIPKAEYVHALVEELDGILLPGSDTDVDPLNYGQDPHPELGTVQFIKDQTDMLVIEAAERKRLPLFAICFGMQILNVYRGGTLIQDIRSQVPNSIKHEQGVPRNRPSHRIRMLNDTKLTKIAGRLDATVNSHHHQAIESVGSNLVATAWTNDGVIEALEDPRSDRFVLGVQWHPEIGWESDDFAQRLFRTFINEAVSAREATTASLSTPA